VGSVGGRLCQLEVLLGRAGKKNQRMERRVLRIIEGMLLTEVGEKREDQTAGKAKEGYKKD